MIPLSPALLIATARSYDGLGEDGGENRGQVVEQFLREVRQQAGAPWCAAFVHHAGYWSHFDDESGTSSWPLPPTASCYALGEFAREKKVLWDTPEVGDVFLKYSQQLKRFVHTGIVMAVSGNRIEMPDGAWYFCRTMEGNTNLDGSAEGHATLSRPRQFLTKRGDAADKFIRWVDLDGRTNAAAA